jgi:hypothetical protein
LTVTHLDSLHLWNIPHSGYFSPEVIVTCLSALTRLRYLIFAFESPQSRPNQKSRRPPLRTRTALPVLHWLKFSRVSEYLEDLVARIDAPLLDRLDITLFHQLILDTPQLTQFITRTPNLKAYNRARMCFDNGIARVTLTQASSQSLFEGVKLGISCGQSDWQLLSLAQVCNSSFPQPLVPAVEHLTIFNDRDLRHWQDDIEFTQWMELFHPFTSVKDLYIASGYVSSIAPALRELVGERTMDVLPTLQNIFSQEPPSGSSGPAQDVTNRDRRTLTERSRDRGTVTSHVTCHQSHVTCYASRHASRHKI